MLDYTKSSVNQQKVRNLTVRGYYSAYNKHLAVPCDV